MPLRSSFLVLFILYSFVGYSQEDFNSGFIVTLQNDTIYGEVKFFTGLKKYETCVFKDEKGTTEFHPTQISGYGFSDGEFYTSRPVSGLFVEALLIGDLSLFAESNRFYVQKDTAVYLLESLDSVAIIDSKYKDNKIYRNKENNWRGVVSYLISDCLRNPVQTVSTLKLNEGSLLRLVSKYNRCKGSEFVELKSTKPWIAAEYGVSFGITHSSLQVTDQYRRHPYMDSNYSSIDPNFGVIFSLSSPRLSSGLALQAGANLIKSSFSSNIIEDRSVSVYYHQTNIDFTTLYFPISLRYSLPERRVGLFVQAGINLDYKLNSDTKRMTERVENGESTQIPETIAFNVLSNQIGGFGSIGIRKTYTKFRGSLSINYIGMSSMTDNHGLTVTNDRISLNLTLTNK